MLKKEVAMTTILKMVPICALLLFFTGCSVISPGIRRDAISGVPLHLILERATAMKGETVILGGIVLEARNEQRGSTLLILQTPLSYADEPIEKDRSEGRLIVRVRKYVDPEVYSAGRRVTVAGVILGRVGTEEPGCLSQCLELEERELYLWPEYRYIPPPLYGPYYLPDGRFGDPYYDPFYPHWYHRYDSPYWRDYPW